MKKFDKTKAIYFGLGIFLVALFLLFSYARIFDEFEYITLDFRYKVRPPQEVLKEIVIIEIGDDSIDRLAQWPFPRNYHALLTKALTSAGVKTNVFDIFFSEKKEGDRDFAKTVKSAGNVYFPYIFDLDRHNPDKKMVHAWRIAEGVIEPLKKACKGEGFINVIPDEDGNVRSVPAVVKLKEKLYPHLTVLVALNDLGIEFEDVKVRGRIVSSVFEYDKVSAVGGELLVGNSTIIAENVSSTDTQIELEDSVFSDNEIVRIKIANIYKRE